MRLNVGKLDTEKLFCALDCKIFCNVHVFATAVITFAGIAFRILVGVESACRRKNGFGNYIFAGDEFEIVLLAFKLFEH